MADPLGPVEGQDAHVGAGSDPLAAEIVGDAVGSLVELAVGQPAGPGHQGQPFRDGVDHHLEQVGEIELPVTHGTTPRLARSGGRPDPVP
jgi:hypothetical protein